MLSHMSVSALELGTIHPQVASGTDEDVGNDEDSVTKRILSGFRMPSLECLTLSSSCKDNHFRAAFDAGMSTVKKLTVELYQYNEACDTTEKLESLARMIRGAVKLNSLTIHNHSRRNPLCPPRQFLQALEACATVTDIDVNQHDGNPHDFTEPEVQQLRLITTRNSELGHFVANPSTFPNDKILTLMIQLSDCPSGLYILTRRLPEVFSFEKGNPLFL
jgi:hypothetical protein